MDALTHLDPLRQDAEPPSKIGTIGTIGPHINGEALAQPRWFHDA